MLRQEVLQPIGIHQAPTVRTREPVDKTVRRGSARGTTRRSMISRRSPCSTRTRARIAASRFSHRGLTQDLLAARGALDRLSDNSSPPAQEPTAPVLQDGFSLHGIHRHPFGQDALAADDVGFGDNEVILFPGRIVAIRAADVANVRRVKKPCPMTSTPRPAQLTDSPLSEACWNAP